MEHPDITKMNRAGTLTEESPHFCPMCGTEYDDKTVIYRLNIRGEITIVGCSECIEEATSAELN
jgi:hypothetical protein